LAERVKKILVVEDNEDNRDILIWRIQSWGPFEILCAANGKEALETAARAKPDLIIMDLKMPVMDGWEATRELRQTDWGKDLPVIALTAQAMEGDEEKALQAGCNDYISKPVTDYLLVWRKIEPYLK
jgi:CheY-like chemotaxis protein